MTERRVDMVRLEREPELYDVEEVLGRDARSVFPSQAANTAAAAATAGALDTDKVREMLGARKFVTETELNEIQATRGQQGEESAEPLKPLVEVLREAKERKEQEFQDAWKMMKTGKNRPLDEDELQFLDSVAEAEAMRRRQQRQQEQQELEEFRRAAAEAQAQAEAAPASTSAPAPRPELKRPASVAPKPLVRPLVKAKPKGTDTTGTAQAQGTGEVCQGSEAQQAKRPKLGDGARVDSNGDKQAQEQGSDEAGLAGLLGGYGSDSDED